MVSEHLLIEILYNIYSLYDQPIILYGQRGVLLLMLRVKILEIVKRKTIL